MQKNEWSRNVVVGLIVAVLFGWWLRGFLYFNWHFKLFSSSSWSYVANELESGWMLGSVSDWIFLLTLLLAVPAFLYLWYLCAKIRWRQLVKKILKWFVLLGKKIVRFFKGTSHHTKTILAPPPPPAPVQHDTKIQPARPRAMGFQGMATPTQEKPKGNIFTDTISSGPTFTAMPQSMDNVGGSPAIHPEEDFANIPLEDIQLPERKAVTEDIPALFAKAGYDLIPDIKTKQQHLDFLAVCGDTILACLFDRESGDWLAEEEPFNGEAPLWFSEVDHRVSPIYELRQSVEELQSIISASMPDMKVKGMMIEEKGNIINAEEMLRIWQELSVIVCRTDIGGTDDLPLTADVLKKVTPASSAMIETLTKLFKGENNG